MKLSEMNEEQRAARREYNREAKQRQRFKEKTQREQSIEAQEAAHERDVRASRNPHFFGESSPGRNANRFAEELQIHREFLRALGQQDVQPGETLRTVAKRTYDAWLAGPYSWERYVPAFNRTLQQFDPDFGFKISGKSFEETWEPPKDCTGDEPIDVADLPDLPRLPKPKLEPKPEQATVQQEVPLTGPGGMPSPVDRSLPAEAQRYLAGEARRLGLR